MWLEPWQIFLAGIFAGWLIMIVLVIAGIIINSRPANPRVQIYAVKQEENSEKEEDKNE